MWGDTDIAGSVPLSTVTRYSMEALEQWFSARLGLDWYQLHVERRIGTPFVRAEVEFQSPVRAHDSLVVAVEVEKVGRSSVLFRVTGRAETRNVQCWQGRFTCVFANADTGQSIPVPDAHRVIFEGELAGPAGPAPP